MRSNFLISIVAFMLLMLSGTQVYGQSEISLFEQLNGRYDYLSCRIEHSDFAIGFIDSRFRRLARNYPKQEIQQKA